MSCMCMSPTLMLVKYKTLPQWSAIIYRNEVLTRFEICLFYDKMLSLTRIGYMFTVYK